MSRRPLTIRNRLLLAAFLATLLGLAIVTVGLFLHDMRQLRQQVVQDASLLADTIAWHSRASLAFDHPGSATETLASLSLFPQAIAGFVLNTEGQLFARWPEGALDDALPSPSGKDVTFESDRLVARRPVTLDGDPLGEVVLVFGLGRIEGRERQYLVVAGAALLVGLLASWLLSWKLHREITQPISELSSAAERVSRDRDYSIQTESREDGEVGMLVRAFNEMLDSLERREAELKQAQEVAENAAATAHERAEEVQRANRELVREIGERRRLEEQLLQSQKMESVGRLAGGVAHDFNNLLTVILGWIDVARLEGGEAVLEESLVEIRRAAERAANLTRSLLAFARKQPLEAQVIDLNTLVLELDKLLHRVLGDDVEVKLRLDSGLQRIKVDRGLFEQMLVNLALNARDAMPSGGSLRIETANVSRSEADRVSADDPPAGDYVMLSVSDTGVGMEPEVVQRIFEPFFTTKAQGKGTGLGLAMVYGIVHQAGGKINVYSVPGEGSVFEILVPRTEATLPTGEAPATDETPVGGQGTVLLVEDELAVRLFMRRVLRSGGFRVIEAMDGLDAQRVAREHDGPIDLLVSDVVMPKVGGPELAIRLRENHPEIRILFTSGYAEEVLDRHDSLPPDTHFLSKPFTPAQLAEKLREMLSQGPSPATSQRRDSGGDP